jgi:hypothetical protein
VEGAVSWAATNVSATQYLALTGAMRTVGRVRERWKYNLWRQTIKKVYLR